MTARGGCGGAIQHSCMPLRSHSQNNQNNRFVRLQVCVCVYYVPDYIKFSWEVDGVQRYPVRCQGKLSGDVSSQVGQSTIPESCTLALLDLLPTVECLSPRQAMQLMKSGREGESSPTHE